MKYLVWQEVPSFGMAFFGVAVIAYGIFRGYRAYKTSKEEQDEVE